MSCRDSESLTQTTLKRDFLPRCSTQIMSPDRTCRLMPDSKAPALLMLVAMTCSLKYCPVLSLPFMVTTRRSSSRRGSRRCSIPVQRSLLRNSPGTRCSTNIYAETRQWVGSLRDGLLACSRFILNNRRVNFSGIPLDLSPRPALPCTAI
jgi:hypothetical protein